MDIKLKRIIFSVALFLGICLPDNNASLAIQGTLPIMLFFLIGDKKNFRINRNLLLFLIVIFFSFLINALFYEPFTIKAILRFFSFCALFLFFPFTSHVSVPVGTLYLILLFILFSQLAYSLGISPLVQFFDTYYPYLGDKKGYDSDFLASGAGDLEFIINRRYGGIFHNPNQCVRYVSVLFVAFLIETKNTGLILKSPFIGFVYISVILSGSRTGLIVVTLFLIYSFLFYGQKKMNFKAIFILAIVLVIGLVSYLSLSDLGLRIFEIGAGTEGSFFPKFVYFDTFYSQLYSVPRFIFGHFTSENIDTIYGLLSLDSEWGELFYNFGALGVITLGLFYNAMWKTKNSEIRFFMLILLWGITSTILFSFKMSFIFMLLLSNYYSGFLSRKLAAKSTLVKSKK